MWQDINEKIHYFMIYLTLHIPRSQILWSTETMPLEFLTKKGWKRENTVISEIPLLSKNY